MMPASHGKPYVKTHGRHDKKALRNLRCLLCEDCGYVMMEYVILGLIILLGAIAACVLGWNTWGWRGLFFGLFGGVLLGGLVYLVGFAIYAASKSILSYFSYRHETIDGCKWTYVIIDGRAKVVAVSPHSGAISIPANLGHCPVTSIEQGIFFGCRDLISVAIPSGVTSIGNSAFKGCSELTSVAIPNSVTSIGEEAFLGCRGLTSVTIPDSVTRIGKKAFHGCSGMADTEGFVIVHNVLYSYHGAGGSVMIPDGVTSIGEEAFLGCRGLTSVTIPASVTSIGEEAFCNCVSLTSVAIPDSVTRIGKEAFQGCCGMADAEGFVIVRNVLYGYHGAGGSVMIPDGVTSIGDGAFEDILFEDCGSLTNVTIPGSVTSIGEWAFCNCISLTSVAIPNSVTSIGEGAFLGCESLTSVTILGALDDYETNIYMGDHNVFFGSVPDELVTYVTSAWTGPRDRWLGYPVVVDAAASREAPVIAPCDGAMVRHGDMRISCATDGAVDDAKAITERIGMIEDPAKRRELEDLKRDRNPRKA